MHVQVANFAVWINNDTEYDTNLGAVAAYLTRGDHLKRLPFIVWRDSSVQHFQVPASRRCCVVCMACWASSAWCCVPRRGYARPWIDNVRV